MMIKSYVQVPVIWLKFHSGIDFQFLPRGVLSFVEVALFLIVMAKMFGSES
jgi:hypothetical protein